MHDLLTKTWAELTPEERVMIQKYQQTYADRLATAHSINGAAIYKALDKHLRKRASNSY